MSDGTADIFAGQPADPDLLAALYDLEHDEIVEDLVFYRQLAERAKGPILDLGCGSGRLFASLLRGRRADLMGVDGTPALLRRAALRIERDQRLATARDEGRLEVFEGDVRRLDAVIARRRRFALVVAVGVLPHLDGPDEAARMLHGVHRLLAADGRLVLDDLGSGQLPDRDLPLSVDWKRKLEDRPVVHRSQLAVRRAPEGLHVLYSTLVDVGQPDGTIARLPASHRLWYPSDRALAELVREAGLAVELSYGSHDLDPLLEASERRILVLVRAGR